MSRYVLLRAAQRDLDGIFEYSLDRWGIDQARHYLESLRDAVSTVATDRRVGALATTSAPVISGSRPGHMSSSISRAQE